MEVIPRKFAGSLYPPIIPACWEFHLHSEENFCTEEDALPNRDAVAVIRDRRWQAQFKRDPAVLGREIYTNGTRFKLIGIAPPRKLDSSLGWKLQGNDIRRI